jgi:hypothetical protein
MISVSGRNDGTFDRYNRLFQAADLAATLCTRAEVVVVMCMSGARDIRGFDLRRSGPSWFSQGETVTCIRPLVAVDVRIL